MKKEKVEKSFFQKGKEFWRNPRYKALIKLGLYALFILFVFCAIDIKGRNQNEIKVPVSTDLSAYKKYVYAYKFTYVNDADEPIKNFEVQGKRYMDSSLFTIVESGTTYFEKNGSYFLANTKEPVSNVLFFDFQKIEPSKLATYIKKMKLDYQTQYADKTEKKGYITSVSDFAFIYMNDTFEKQGNVLITTYEKNDEIYRVTLDMRAYNGILVDIQYQNIHNVEDFREDYS